MVDILIPTFDNRVYLEQCVRSIRQNTASVAYHISVINNGAPGSVAWLGASDGTVIEAGGNRGWTGGLALGLERTSSDAVVFLNDDTLIPLSSAHWLEDMLRHLEDPRTAAVGPACNECIGVQSIFWPVDREISPVAYLVGFCVLLRRAALDEVGGVDTTLPGGDDIDLSIRLRKAGYTLLADHTVFVYHYGYRTGIRVHGPPHIKNGWNSREYADKTYRAIEKKHGKALASTTFAYPDRPELLGTDYLAVVR